jgi:hypothetical protein
MREWELSRHAYEEGSGAKHASRNFNGNFIEILVCLDQWKQLSLPISAAHEEGQP